MSEANNVPTASPPAAHHLDMSKRDTLIALKWPITFDGKTYETVKIRRPSARYLTEVIETLATGNGIDAMKMLTVGCPPEVFDELDDDDIAQIEAVVMPFFERRLGALQKSEPPSPSSPEPSTSVSTTS